MPDQEVDKFVESFRILILQVHTTALLYGPDSVIKVLEEQIVNLKQERDRLQKIMKAQDSLYNSEIMSLLKSKKHD